MTPDQSPERPCLLAAARGFVGSSVGAKALMALSGLGLIGFLVVHMGGNLQMHLGPEPMNAYAKALKGQPLVLWPARLGLLGMFLLHVGLAFHLNAKNAKARPIAYASDRAVASTWASRHMLLTGALVLAFLGYHLAHFTLGLTHADHFALVDAQGRHDVYAMVVHGFRSPVVAGSYVLAMFVLALHLSHGFGSLWRSLGTSSPALVDALRKAGIAVALAITLGFATVPIGVVAGTIGREVPRLDAGGPPVTELGAAPGGREAGPVRVAGGVR